MGLGQSKYAVLCILVPCWSMLVSTWEEYHTGTLYLGYINGPVEGVLIAVAILVVSAVKGAFLGASMSSDQTTSDVASSTGPGFWAQTVSETFGHLPLVPSSWQLLDLVMLFLGSAFFVAHLPLWSVGIPSRSPRPCKDRV